MKLGVTLSPLTATADTTNLVDRAVELGSQAERQPAATADDRDTGGAQHPPADAPGAYPLRRRIGSPLRRQAMIICG
jgi:hypothetical protein